MQDELATTHSDLRLMQRTGEIHLSMTDLWEQSVPCELKNHSYDEARCSPRYGVILLMEGGKVVAVLGDISEANIDADNMQSYLDAMIDEPKDLYDGTDNVHMGDEPV